MAEIVSSEDQCNSSQGYCVMEWMGEPSRFVPVSNQCASGHACPDLDLGIKEEFLELGMRFIVCCENGSSTP